MHKGIFTTFCVLALLHISSCAKVPEYTEINGIKFASEPKIKLDAQNSDLDDDIIKTASTEKDNEYSLKLKISEDKNVEFLYIENENIKEGVSTLRALPNVSSIDLEKAVEIFDGNKYKVRDYAKEFKEAEEAREVEDHKEGNEKFFEGDTYFCICSEDCIPEMPAYGTWHLVTAGEAGFVFANIDLEVEAKGKAEFEKAKKLVSDTLEEIGMGEVSFDEKSDFEENGIRTILFQPIIEELPLVTNAAEGNIGSNVIKAFSDAEVSNNGIVSISIRECLWKVTDSTEKKEPLSVEKALQYVKLYEENKKLFLDEEQVYEIQLAYFPTTEDWKEATLTPVWWIHVPDSEIAGMNYGKTAQLGINAYTGEIEFDWR